MTVYLKEINGRLTAAPDKDINILIEEGYQPFDENDYSLYLINAKQFINGELIDEPTEEFRLNQKTKQLADLQSQIDAIDLKSIRALREGGIKDESTNLTWLEYYTQQIQELREKINQIKTE